MKHPRFFIILITAILTASASVTAQPPTELSSEERATLGERAAEFKETADESNQIEQDLNAQLEKGGDCGPNLSVRDCLLLEISALKARRLEATSEDAAKIDGQIDELEAQLNAPSRFQERAQTFTTLSASLGAMVERNDFSFKDQPKEIRATFSGSWKYLIKPGPLVAISLGGIGYGVSELTHVNRTSQTYYANPQKQWPKAISQIGTQTGYAYPVLVPMYLFGALTKNQRVLDVANVTVSAVAVNEIITFALKNAFQYGAPNIGERPNHSGNDGMPSGHTSTAFAMATAVDQVAGHKWGIPAYVIATFVGLTRIEQNVHFPRQVIFGAGIGIASGLAASASYKAYVNGKQNRIGRIFSGEKDVDGRKVNYDWTPVVAPGFSGVSLRLGW